MKNSIKLCLIAMVLFSVSCSNETITEATNTSQDGDIFSRASNSTVLVEERPDGFPDGAWLVVEGASSTLHRNKNGITVNFKTNGLIPGNAYTLWWIVFGENPGPPASLPAGGHVVGGNGIGNFSAHLSTGPVDLSTSNPNASPVFNNPETAEVHMVLRSHGVAVPGIIDEQISEYFGGCDPYLTLPGGPGMIWADSNQVGYCADMQLAKHPPVNN